VSNFWQLNREAEREQAKRIERQLWFVADTTARHADLLAALAGT
jgi:hypothetical protein